MADKSGERGRLHIRRFNRQRGIRQESHTTMPKGMFTHGVCVLLKRSLSLDELEAALVDFKNRKRLFESDKWALGGPTLVVAYQAESIARQSAAGLDRKIGHRLGRV